MFVRIVVIPLSFGLLIVNTLSQLTKSLLLFMYDSRAAASNDEEMGEYVLVDWRE